MIYFIQGHRLLIGIKDFLKLRFVCIWFFCLILNTHLFRTASVCLNVKDEDRSGCVGVSLQCVTVGRGQPGLSDGRQLSTWNGNLAVQTCAHVFVSFQSHQQHCCNTELLGPCLSWNLKQQNRSINQYYFGPHNLSLCHSVLNCVMYLPFLSGSMFCLLWALSESTLAFEALVFWASCHSGGDSLNRSSSYLL